MNCYTDTIGSKIYCLNPISQKTNYYLSDLSGFRFINSIKNPCYECVKKNLHRIDGPAVELFNSEEYWYFYGERINCKSQEEFKKILKMKVFL